MITESTPPVRYQFTAEQTKVIRSLAFYLQMTGILISVNGLFLCATGDVVSWRSVGGIVVFIIGVLVIRAASLFQQISTAEGCEVGQLIAALTQLRNAHRLLIDTLIILFFVALFWYYR